MMDTDILFRDGRRFSNDFNDMPSLMSSDSSYSTNCDGSDSDTFSSWNFNMGLSNEFELMLDRFGFGASSDEVFGSIADEWKNTPEVPTFDTNTSIGHEALLSNLEFLKQEPIDYIDKVKQEPDISTTDIQYAVANIKKELPAFDDTTPVFDETVFPECYTSENFGTADLPPHLDLCSFINGEDLTTNSFGLIPKTEVQDEPKFKAGRKKIDLQAQRYIIENDEEEEENVDIETISENGNNPVLEAGDLNSLLEQFEATEVIPDKSTATDEVDEKADFSTLSVPETSLSEVPTKKHKHKNDTKQIKKPVQGAFMDASKQGCTSSTQLKYVKSNDKPEKNKHKSLPIKCSPTKNSTSSNEQIIEALPEELIARIRESVKRKRIAIIDPVPSNGIKRRKTQENVTHVQSAGVAASHHQNALNLQSIVLDHSYCSFMSSPKASAVKDSGYISAEEEEKTLVTQPLVKNADGKLMISLLKMNTLKSNNDKKNIKKLNIEEYKKRRQGVLSTPASQSNSPLSSNCSSPLPEDENTRRLKHEEKLRKMALELLNTPPKSMCANVKTVSDDQKTVPVKTTPPPVDMDVKTIVSIGVNTDITGKDPFAPAEKLEEIKPLLEQASAKINSNSLINSLIENIPKVIKSDVATNTPTIKKEHGEDKTIIYLPKNRKLPQTFDTAVQTSITLLDNNKRRYRHRRDSSRSSSSSENSDCSNKRSIRYHGSKYSRSRSASTDSSSSSRSSVRSRYRSNSRSPSPQNRRRRRKRGYDEEYVQDIEERRVVYVGKLVPRTTKEDLYRRFSRFGPIKTISIHFRNAGDNYGFVTFVNKVDAYKAIEHGNDNPYDVQYDLSFGGRRLFCKTSYSDLDNMREDSGYGPRTSSSGDSFDRLLREMQEKLKKRKV